MKTHSESFMARLEEIGIKPLHNPMGGIRVIPTPARPTTKIELEVLRALVQATKCKMAGFEESLESIDVSAAPTKRSP